MKAWRLNHLGGELRLEEAPMPVVRPGSILVRVEASTLMSYMKPYVEGRLTAYHAPAGGFTPGGNCVGVIDSPDTCISSRFKPRVPRSLSRCPRGSGRRWRESLHTPTNIVSATLVR
jgi:hypothetical protein